MAIRDIRHRTPAILKAAFPGLLWQMHPAVVSEATKQPLPGNLYLTFDDGPVPGPTEYVLDVLARFEIKAAFFAVGDNIRKHPELAYRIVQEGHTLANHTQHHVKGWESSTKAYLQEVEECHRELEKVGAISALLPAPLFRPPYGRITPGQAKLLSHTHRIVMWSVLSADYDRNITPSECLVKTHQALHDGAIIVFHDSHKAFGRLESALPALIEVARFEGYGFGRLL